MENLRNSQTQGCIFLYLLDQYSQKEKDDALWKYEGYNVSDIDLGSVGDI